MVGLAAFAPDLIASVGGLFFPPIMDFVKKKFLKREEDTVEATLSTLATTKPEMIGEFVNGQAKLMEAQTAWFNRDVIGTTAPWVVNLRAAIRPVTVALGLIGIFAHCSDTWIFEDFTMDVGIRVFFETNISSWFGNRLNTGGK